MTGQSLLDRMELLNQELQLQSGEEDVVRGLIALNCAQDYFESLAATRKILGSGVGTVVTAASTETTSYPTGLLRIDRLQRLSGGASTLPVSELTTIRRAGGHAVGAWWPLNLTLSTSTGSPQGYWTNGTLIYWAPLPDAVYTIRYYGMTAAADITASGTFTYPDMIALPMAAFANRLMKVGVDDSLTDMTALASELFNPALDALSNSDRDGAKGFEYTSVHST